MFKKLALSGLMLSLCSFPLLAQQTTAPTAQSQTTTRAGRNHSMGQQQMADPETRAHKMTDRMTKQLGLDESTSKKVYDVALARAQKIDAIQASSDDNRAKAQALKANADDFKMKIKGVLTPDQFAKFDLMHKKMQKGQRKPDGSDMDKEDNN